MIIEKEYLINSTTEKTWSFISDIDKFKGCIPDVETYEQKDPKHFVVIARPSFAFLKSSVTMNWKISELRNNYGKLEISGKVIAGGFKVNAELKAIKNKKNTLLTLKINGVMKGLLEAVPNSVIEGAGSIISDRIFECVRVKVENAKRE